MSRPFDGTPCPSSVPSREPVDLRSDYLRDSFDDGDTTSKIDFTIEFQPSSRVAGMKRRAAATKMKQSGSSIEFAVHQDEGSPSTEHNSSESQRYVPARDKMSILSQPAQRPRSKMSFPSESKNIAPSKTTTTTGNSRQTRLAINKEVGAQHGLGKTAGRVFEEGNKTIKKPARRGTVYIPSEDTTMPTVWMGVFSPIKDVGSNTETPLSDHAADLTGIAARMAEKRGPRKSSVMAAPRRAPLRHSLRPPQETTISEDIPGHTTGKENLPPGHELLGQKKVKQTKILGDSSQAREASRRPAFDLIKRPRPSSCSPGNLSSKSSRPAQPQQTSEAAKLQSPIEGAVSEHDVKRDFVRLRINAQDKDVVRISRSSEALTTTPQVLSAGRIEKLPTKLMVPKIAAAIVDQSYPLLSEDIENPSLYENNWLAHQEIAITQLVNNLFSSSKGSAGTIDDLTIRSWLLNIYQDQSFIFLQKRLQASLLYGSLSVPKEILAKSSRLPDDLGLKQTFLNLWLNTYDPITLQACAEVIIGRECSTSPRTSSPAQVNSYTTQRTASRQALSRFLETFLVRNADTIPDNAVSGPSATGLHRTLLRSLMLIKLLDETKTSPQTPFTGCLFQPLSPYKSSVAVVQAMAQMLNPAAGNIVRSLSHLNFSVSHIQYSLEEYDYHIDNLAVNLRDGVRLTRLVELLLYPSISHLSSHTPDGDTTTIVTMPAGEILTMMQGEQYWPLSQHLKFPCLGRATKLYNVQIALSAVSGIKDVGRTVEDIKAEHIVDGFREQTVAFLWGLVSKWGLGSLIDWADLKYEIRRLGGTLEANDEYADEDDLAWHKSLLKRWAFSVAARQGLKVSNLTTSFADGRVFEAIANEYEPYLHVASKTSSSSSSPYVKRQLSQRLADLGCSGPFGERLQNPSSSFPSAAYLTISQHLSSSPLPTPTPPKSLTAPSPSRPSPSSPRASSRHPRVLEQQSRSSAPGASH
jgi:abnormal spindle-like microcephaly-associated protein